MKFEYNKIGDVIYMKLSEDYEYWFKYDEDDYAIEITKQEFENIKIREYNSRTKCSRFELIEI